MEFVVRECRHAAFTHADKTIAHANLAGARGGGGSTGRRRPSSGRAAGPRADAGLGRSFAGAHPETSPENRGLTLFCFSFGVKTGFLPVGLGGGDPRACLDGLKLYSVLWLSPLC